jgi:plasmid stability protein
VVLALKAQAARRGHSLEAELRQVLGTAARRPRAALAAELAGLRDLTPSGPRALAEDLVREGRDDR